MNQLTVGRGAPSERHTRRPLSSGAKTKSVGFSNQKGAAVSCKHTFFFLDISPQRDGKEKKKKKTLKMHRTFDWHGYCVPDVALFVGSGAHIFTSVIKGHSGDLNHLVKILHSRWRSNHKVLAVLGPGDVRRRPWWWQIRSLNKITFMKLESFCRFIQTHLF